MAKQTDPPDITLAFCCVGRRVELLQAFRAAAERLGVRLRLVGTDNDPTAPAMACVDVPVRAPRVTDPQYVPHLLDTVRTHNAIALIPTIDTDLPLLSQNREVFSQFECTPMIAAPEVIDICRDKVRTYEHLKQHGIDAPETYTPQQLAGTPNNRFPLFIKPRSGSASQWVHKVEDQLDLDYYLARIKDPIIQEFVEGTEHTLDVYVGLTGEARCVVPRRRWAVRGGEVCKGVVVKDLNIMNAGKRLVESLGTSVRGLVTLQCIVTAEGRIRFIEINPRFGGGAPMGIAAGANYPLWLLQELLGQTPEIAFDGFRHGTCMLRYDWSVFVTLGDDLEPRLEKPTRDFPRFE
jgi:carbamoyl-phosphate synthase large subunit